MSAWADVGVEAAAHHLNDAHGGLLVDERGRRSQQLDEFALAPSATLGNRPAVGRARAGGARRRNVSTASPAAA